MVGVLDHQMDVERKLSVLADALDDRRSKGNVIDEMPVHDVAMNPVGARSFDPSDFLGEAREIGGKNGGGDKNRHGVME